MKKSKHQHLLTNSLYERTRTNQLEQFSNVTIAYFDVQWHIFVCSKSSILLSVFHCHKIPNSAVEVWKRLFMARSYQGQHTVATHAHQIQTFKAYFLEIQTKIEEMKKYAFSLPEESIESPFSDQFMQECLSRSS